MDQQIEFVDGELPPTAARSPGVDAKSITAVIVRVGADHRRGSPCGRR
ncbi:hypothetical protein GS508_12730 [Rhodococcus hoagii]|nr:hypothetical protein [Prescottella equi]